MHEQVIYFGAPGTGKSHAVKELIKSQNRKTKLFRVTIHPEFTYGDFVGQILPRNSAAGKVDFAFVPGPFTLALMAAFGDTNLQVYLVLEELSRGNTAAIFGDVFQLLDRNRYFESEFEVTNRDVASVIPELMGDTVYLPSNLNIIGTVNMNDQNVYPMDTAFKRRFDWRYVSSTPALLNNGSGMIDGHLNNPYFEVATDNGDNIIETNWLSFYSALNNCIVDKEKGLGRNEDRQIGQFFLKFNEQTIRDSYSLESERHLRAKEEIDSVVREKLLLYLWQDVQGTVVFDRSVSLFLNEITCFGDLYDRYGKKQVFSDLFLDEFLRPNANKYEYSD